MLDYRAVIKSDTAASLLNVSIFEYNKANSLLTGILTNTANQTSGAAADASHELKNSTVGKSAAAVRHKFESGVGNAALKTAGVAARIATLPVRPFYGAAKNAVAKVKSRFRNLGSSAEKSLVKPPPKSGGGKESSTQKKDPNKNTDKKPDTQKFKTLPPPRRK